MRAKFDFSVLYYLLTGKPETEALFLIVINEILPRTATKTATKGNVPCLQCGSLKLTPDKGEELEPVSSNVDVPQRNTSVDEKLREKFLSGLFQQINLLEMEIAHLKGPEKLGRSEIGAGKNEADHLKEQLKLTKEEITQKGTRLDALSAENKRLQRKAAELATFNEEDRKRYMEDIASLACKKEELEMKLCQIETRYQKCQSELEKYAILCKDRDKALNMQTEELNSKEEKIHGMDQDLEMLQQELLRNKCQTMTLQDKFQQSSAHIMEETLRVLREENCDLHLQLKRVKIAEEEHKGRQTKTQDTMENLLSENARLASSLSEVQKKLECEVRARENRDAKLISDSQDAITGKEKARSIQSEFDKIQSELERERQKSRTSHDKMLLESQQVTSLELKVATQKSIIAEMEGSLEIAKEATKKIRHEYLVTQEKYGRLLKELEGQVSEVKDLSARLISTEHRLMDSERRVETLATLQSHRWMEFSKMADNMKEMSNNMLLQSKSNTRKAVIRADLDEELDT